MVPHDAELDAYEAVLRAVVLQPTSWETEDVLTALRESLHISNHEHSEVRQRVDRDPLIQELRAAAKRAGGGGGGGGSSGGLAPTGGAVEPLLPLGALGGVALGAGGTAQHMPPLAGGPLLVPQHAPLLAPAPAGGSPFSQGSQPFAAQLTPRTLSDSGAAPRSSTAGGGKPAAVAPSKQGKHGARLEAALPAGVDLAESDLRGYVIERRRDEGALWQAGIVAGSRREQRGQKLTIVYNPDTPSEWFEGDVVLAKSKAGALWRFAQPPQRQALDWGAVLARAAAASARPGSAGGDKKPLAAAKRRKGDEEGDDEEPPYKSAALEAALQAARESGSAEELRGMCASIAAARARTIEALAAERCREALAGAAGGGLTHAARSAGPADAERSMAVELATVRRRLSETQTALQQLPSAA